MTLFISNLHVSIGDKPILKGLTLDVPPGEVHAILGANEADASDICYVDARRLP